MNRNSTHNFTGSQPAWRTLCGLAVQLVGSQESFKKQSNILKRLFTRYGPEETERFLRGALLLRWSSLTGLGSADGLGRRMALAAWWQSQNSRKANLPESLGSILRKAQAQP